MNTQEYTHLDETSLEFSKVLTRSYERFTKVLFPVLAATFLTLFVVLAFCLLVFAVTFGLYTLLPSSLFVTGVLVTFVLLAAIALLYALLGVGIMNMRLVDAPTFDFVPLYKKSLKESVRVYTISLGATLGILGGFVFLIIPGIWLSILFSFVVYAALFEKKGFEESLRTSIRLVKGHFWTIVSFVLFVGLVNFCINLIPVLSIPLSLLFGIFANVLMYELYKTLHSFKSVNEVQHKEEKNIIFFTKLCVALILILLVVVSVALPFILIRNLI